jgi:hypothetical protein
MRPAGASPRSVARLARSGIVSRIGERSVSLTARLMRLCGAGYAKEIDPNNVRTGTRRRGAKRLEMDMFARNDLHYSLRCSDRTPADSRKTICLAYKDNYVV